MDPALPRSEMHQMDPLRAENERKLFSSIPDWSLMLLGTNLPRVDCAEHHRNPLDRFSAPIGHPDTEIDKSPANMGVPIINPWKLQGLGGPMSGPIFCFSDWGCHLGPRRQRFRKTCL